MQSDASSESVGWTGWSEGMTCSWRPSTGNVCEVTTIASSHLLGLLRPVLHLYIRD